MSDILGGAALLLQEANALALVGGLVLGFVVGILPGFGGSNASAIVLPFSIGMPLEAALLLMVGIYAGSSYAGSIPAILLNIPGTPGAAATALDGYPLMKKGKGTSAISAARLASTIGGIVAIALVLAIIRPMSHIALSFGTRELFIVALIGLTLIAAVMGGNFLKGLICSGLGLLIAVMSASPVTAEVRWTLGRVELYETVPFIPALIGLFAFTEMFVIAGARRSDAMVRDEKKDEGENDRTVRPGSGSSQRGQIREGMAACVRFRGHAIRGGLLGALIGSVPGVGSIVGNFTSYAMAKRLSKRPSDFGKGSMEGVVASESADNGVSAGTLVPTLTLGIPGSGTAAVMLAAMYLHGVRPGPQVMNTHTAEMYAVLGGMLVASVLILPLGIAFSAPLVMITRLKPAFLVAPTIVLASVGAFAMRGSVFDVGLAFVFGLLGLTMRRLGYPIVPLVLGLVLGPIMEGNLMRALQLGLYDPTYLVESGLAVVLWCILAALVGGAAYRSLRSRRKVRAMR